MPGGLQPGIGRLRTRPEFLQAASGRRFHTDRMTIQARRRADGEGAAGLRVGFTLTRKVGHATERNRIRRRLRSAVAAVGRAFQVEPVDVVVIGRRPAFAAPYPVLLDDLARGLATLMRDKNPRAKATGPGLPTDPRSAPRART